MNKAITPTTAKKRLACVSLLAVLCLLPSILSAQSGKAAPPSPLPTLKSLLSLGVYNDLLVDGKVLLTAAPGQGPSLLPRYPGSEGIAAALAAAKPNLIVEALYAYRRPQPADPKAELKSLYGTLLSISSLEGIQYYSASRKKMRTFYEQSYRIDGPDTKKRLADASPPPGSLPPTATFYAFQKDLTFGSNIYEWNFTAFPEALLLETINLTGLTYIGIPVIPAKGLKARLLIIQTDEAILFYVVNAADAPSIGIVRDKVQDSIGNRAEALYKWFEAKQKALGR
jgi:hypothetical protein